MPQAQEYDDNIKLLLWGNEAEIREGFALIDKHLRDPICGWLRVNYYPGISADDLADLWQDTLVELLKQVATANIPGNVRCSPIYAESFQPTQSISAGGTSPATD